MTLSEASTNPREGGGIRHEEHTNISIPGDGILQGAPEAQQEQLQAIEISRSTPGQSAADFGTGANIWDFHNLEFMEETPLWTIDNRFAMGGIEDGTSGQLEDIQLQAFDYSGGHGISNGHDPSGKPGLQLH
jgi:hypothetical protein